MKKYIIIMIFMMISFFCIFKSVYANVGELKIEFEEELSQTNVLIYKFEDYSNGEFVSLYDEYSELDRNSMSNLDFLMALYDMVLYKNLKPVIKDKFSGSSIVLDDIDLGGYLVILITNSGKTTFDPFFVRFPNEINGILYYDVVAKPKVSADGAVWGDFEELLPETGVNKTFIVILLVVGIFLVIFGLNLAKGEKK